MSKAEHLDILDSTATSDDTDLVKKIEGLVKAISQVPLSISHAIYTDDSSHAAACVFELQDDERAKAVEMINRMYEYCTKQS